MTRFAPSGRLHGSLAPPPDKSISHRAAILAAMADGESTIRSFLDSADTRSTLAAVAALGATVEVKDADGAGGLEVDVQGIGLQGPGEHSGGKRGLLDVGNAG